jgi:hypothetical protein
VPLLFALTMFVSATLLFLVQPMVGKMILPLLGGTPAVWNTCMVFYQALLLAGYYYSHVTTSIYDSRRQTIVHSVILPIIAMVLGVLLSSNHSPIPIAKALSPQGDEIPFFGVIAVLFVAIALPFFVVSTSAPLLQKWFAYTGHPSSKDPYFLYGASNFGSLLALIAYPTVVEPNLRIIDQTWVWAIGYVVLVGMCLYCGHVVRNAKPKPIPTDRGLKIPIQVEDPEPPPTLLTKLRWLGLAFVHSFESDAWCDNLHVHRYCIPSSVVDHSFSVVSGYFYYRLFANAKRVSSGDDFNHSGNDSLIGLLEYIEHQAEVWHDSVVAYGNVLLCNHDLSWRVSSNQTLCKISDQLLSDYVHRRDVRRTLQ